MKTIFVCLLPIFMISPIIAQKAEIAEILDCNLFKLDDGRMVKLANVNAPSIEQADSTLIDLAEHIFNYANSDLVEKQYEIKISPSAQEKDRIIPVHLIQKFPLQTKIINEVYLKKGFGKYQPIDSIYREKYIKAAKHAEQKKAGIWNPDHFRRLKQRIRMSSITIGYGHFRGDSDEPFKPYQEANLLFTSEDYRFSGIKLKVGIFRYKEEVITKYEVDDVLTKKVTDQILYFSFISSKSLIYVGFDFGLSGFKMLDQSAYEGIEQLIIPNLGVKFGQMGKAYLSFRIFEDIIFRPSEIGFNYHFKDKVSRIWVGASGWESSWNFGVKSILNINNSLILRAESIFAGDRFDFGFRLGLGVVSGD